METKVISNTDLVVSDIALGTCNFGTGISEAESYRIMDAYAEAGGRLIDTAKIYADWASEEKSMSEKVIGRWLRSNGAEGIVVATKGAHPDDGQPNRLDERSIMHDLDQSLEHLGLDCIPLYWLHRDDPAREAGEIIETMNQAVKEKKIRYFACSNWRTERIQAANDYAEKMGLKPFVGSQIMYSAARVVYEEMGDKTLMCMDQAQWEWYCRSRMTVLAYSSQHRGIFTKIAAGEKPISCLDQPNWPVYHRLMELAKEKDTDVTAVVLAYLQCNAADVIPIVGCSSVAQLQDSLKQRIMLTHEEISSVDRVKGWYRES